MGFRSISILLRYEIFKNSTIHDHWTQKSITFSFISVDQRSTYNPIYVQKPYRVYISIQAIRSSTAIKLINLPLQETVHWVNLVDSLNSALKQTQFVFKKNVNVSLGFPNLILLIVLKVSSHFYLAYIFFVPYLLT